MVQGPLQWQGNYKLGNGTIKGSIMWWQQGVWWPCVAGGPSKAASCDGNKVCGGPAWQVDDQRQQGVGGCTLPQLLVHRDSVALHAAVHACRRQQQVCVCVFVCVCARACMHACIQGTQGVIGSDSKCVCVRNGSREKMQSASTAGACQGDIGSRRGAQANIRHTFMGDIGSYRGGGWRRGAHAYTRHTFWGDIGS